ncbi:MULTISPECIES: phage antirepressor KilAC domain-containing protein [Roseomonadaceae]|uniref:Phage antirepressor KilAC domain-containing protein n=1 Tax=Falsiroseomonas oleicola TaxID=2801474 RepID=A0ABS6HAL6_9PROT|nr:phage antirepressor KilAC domain-containing protein [Roseomonas oleicola]MBU8545780.1 phage antirepressor KilAC domain-containing protein [Roseomonas oleicola]
MNPTADQDTARVALRRAVEAAVDLAAMECGPSGVDQACIHRAFRHRGASRATVYRWMAGALRRHSRQLGQTLVEVTPAPPTQPCAMTASPDALKAVAAALEAAAAAVAAAQGLITAMAEGKPVQADAAGAAEHALARLVEAPGALCLRDAAKALRVGPGFLVEEMRRRGWLFSSADGRRLVGYQERVEAGEILHRPVELPGGRVEVQALLTSKGLKRLALALEASTARQRHSR